MTRFTVVVLSFIVISLMFVGQSSARIDPETCAGMWLLDEGKGDTAKDSSKNSNDGKLMGDLEWVAGKFGKALGFDSNDHVLCGRDESINSIADALTIVAWVFWKGGGTYDYIVSNDRDCCGQYKGYSLNLSYTSFKIWDDKSQGHSVGWSNPKPPRDEWCHAAGTFDGGQLKIYLNGTLNNSVAFSGKIGIPATYEFAIGGLGHGPGTYNIDGIIDEVAVFNVALIENDIKSIMTKGLEAIGTAVSQSGKLTTTWAEIKK